jgi:hypothetical protein
MTRRLILVVLALGCLACPGVAIGKYRLRVVQAALQTSHLFWSQNGSVTFQYQAKNLGPAKSPAGAVALYIYHGTKAIGLAVQHIPALNPGISRIQVVTKRVRADHLVTLGGYNAEVCAYAAHRSPVPAQCYKLKGGLAVIAEKWGGQLTTHATHPSGVIEDTQSRRAAFMFQSFRSGRAKYKLSATIQITDSGTTPGGLCTWTGAYVLGNPVGTLTLDYNYPHPSYIGVGFLPPPGTYPINGSCGFGMEAGGPISGDFFLTDECSVGVPHCSGTPLPFGATKLTGSFTEPNFNVVNHWSLTA